MLKASSYSFKSCNQSPVSIVDFALFLQRCEGKLTVTLSAILRMPYNMLQIHTE